jgi:hypothetical protein
MEASFTNWTDIASVIAASIAAGIAVMTYFFHTKQHRLNGLMEAFKLLNNEDRRKARDLVYAIFEIYSDNHDLKTFVEESHKKYVEMVRSDLDQMGALVRNGTIQKKGFLEAYGETSYRCWNALKAHIEKERIGRNFEHYMQNFQWLSDEAVKYWHRRGIDISKLQSY